MEGLEKYLEPRHIKDKNKELKHPIVHEPIFFPVDFVLTSHTEEISINGQRYNILV